MSEVLPSPRPPTQGAHAFADEAEDRFIRCDFRAATIAAREGLQQLGLRDGNSSGTPSGASSVLCDTGRWRLARDAGHARGGGEAERRAGAPLHERLTIVLLQAAFERGAAECERAIATAEAFFSADGTLRFSFEFGFKWLEIALAMGKAGTVARAARALLSDIGNDSPPPAGAWAAQHARLVELLAVHALPRLGRRAEGLALVARAPLDGARRAALLARCCVSSDGAVDGAASASARGGDAGVATMRASSAAKAASWAATLLASMGTQRGKRFALQAVAACAALALFALVARRSRALFAAVLAKGRAGTVGLVSELKQIAVGT